MMEEGKIFKRIVLSVFCIFLLIVIAGEMLAIGQGKGVIHREDNAFLDFLFNQTGTRYYKGTMKKDRIPVDWNKLYPVAETTEEKNESMDTGTFSLDFSVDKIEDYKKVISDRTERNSIFFRGAQVVKNWCEEVMGFNHTYYEFGTVDKIVINGEAEEIEKLNEFCQEEQIDFLYLNPGTENTGNGKTVDAINANTDVFMEELMRKGVSAIDMRKVFFEDDLSPEQMFFRTNAHWKSTSGLYVANYILKYLSENTENSSFIRESLEKERFKIKKIDPLYTMEEYEYYVPIESDRFRLVIPDKKVDIRGDFEEVFLNQNPEEIFYNIEECYETWMRTNEAVSHTYNEAIKSGKKILLITDSFSWCVTPYLSMVVKEIDTLYLPDFTGSIKNYITRTKPDIVIYSYTPKRIGNDSCFDIK